MAEKSVSPNEAAKWFKGVIKNHSAKKWLREFLCKHHPECLDPIMGNERTEAIIAEYFRDENFSIAGMTNAQVASRLERTAAKKKKGDSGIPSEIEDELRKRTCIQSLPLRLLNVMWERRSASQGDLVPYVWGDRTAPNRSSTII